MVPSTPPDWVKLASVSGVLRSRVPALSRYVPAPARVAPLATVKLASNFVVAPAAVVIVPELAPPFESVSVPVCTSIVPVLLTTA